MVNNNYILRYRDVGGIKREKRLTESATILGCEGGQSLGKADILNVFIEYGCKEYFQPNQATLIAVDLGLKILVGEKSSTAGI
uniref:Uncharacterized protein n=1 Tax=Arion vulgaris TaxID=1028688 RepID=A0A0B7B8L5_9EUPU